ncbi:hypothetical protein [uncultured Photobacterium sp.]|uniref:hypothetical protein n=1 Tax=uncultured Photobacterium sp. TaxID=173973 RepID=UPI0026035BAC|nr:hypothetical protein [uncultured Photobacterium sp.]
MRFSQKVSFMLSASLLLLAILLISVGGRTYKTESVIGRVVDANTDFFHKQNNFYLQVMSDQTNSMVNLNISDGLYCPVGAQVVFVKRTCILFGDNNYEFVSCRL